MHLHHCTRCSEELAGNPEKERGDWFIRCLGCGARNIIALAGMSDVLGINWYTAFNGGMSVVSTTNDVIPLLGADHHLSPENAKSISLAGCFAV